MKSNLIIIMLYCIVNKYVYNIFILKKKNEIKNENPCPKDQKKKKKYKRHILQQYTSAVYVGCNKLAYS